MNLDRSGLVRWLERRAPYLVGNFSAYEELDSLIPPVEGITISPGPESAVVKMALEDWAREHQGMPHDARLMALDLAEKLGHA